MADPQRLRLQKVVLYKHGVGYFEREGVVEGDARVELGFAAQEMDDVLKSLTVLDLDGGRIESIAYPSATPVRRKLQDLGLEVPPGRALRGVLEALRGAEVAVLLGGERLIGRILGLETRSAQQDGAVVETHTLVLLTDGGTLRAVPVDELQHLDFLDEAVRRDLAELLALSLAGDKRERRVVTISARGDGPRRLQASYLVEAPLWKTSYRVVLGAEEALLQAWALVDNTQEEDWVDVSLVLVAGLPVSFVHDLYAPRFRPRPRVEVEQGRAYGAPVLQETQETMAGAHEEVAFAMAPAGIVAAAPAPRGKGAARSRRQAVSAVTRAAEAGELFEYVVTHPVSLGRHRSALVPILQAPVGVERVAVYNPDVRARNPMSALRLENTTGVALEGGPVAIGSETDHLGEAMLETMRPGERKLLPYAVELGCVVSLDHRARKQERAEIRLARGVMTMVRYHVQETIYVLEHRRDEPLVLYLDHRFARGASLVDTPEPIERTEDFLRFRVELAPRETSRFTIAERTEALEHFDLGQLRGEQLTLWVGQGALGEAERTRLAPLVAVREAIDALQRELEGMSQDLDELAADQARHRENLVALGGATAEKKLRERYVQALADADERIEAVRTEMASARRAIREREDELARLVQSSTDPGRASSDPAD